MTDYAEDVKRYVDAPDQGAIDTIVAYCGIALRSSADAGIQKVCDRMKGNTRKHRVTFYCLLAEETGTMDKLG